MSDLEIAGNKADPFTPSLESIPCKRCGEEYMREHDLQVHEERHRPAPDLSKEEKEGKVHCPKGCNRWVVLDDPDWVAHVELCDGAPPIILKTQKTAYRWWCEEHSFGTNGPKPWGFHKKEHHDGKEPPEKPEKKKEEAMAQVRRLLRGELSRLEIEERKMLSEKNRIMAALKCLDSQDVGPEGTA